MIIGFDTGFFVRLLERSPQAEGVWQTVLSGQNTGVLSCISIFELHRIGLRGNVRLAYAKDLADDLPNLCDVVWVTAPDLLRRAARVAHGNHMSMADAIILVSLIEAGAGAIYTTDPDFERYSGGPAIHRL